MADDDVHLSDDELRAAVDRLNAVPWNSARRMTEEAVALAAEHVARMRDVLVHLRDSSGRPPLEGYSDAQSAGYDAVGYDAFFDILYNGVDFGRGVAKTPLVLTLASHEFWTRDPDMGHLPDPWEPLVRLYELGFVSSFDQDDVAGTLDLVVPQLGGPPYRVRIWGPANDDARPPGGPGSVA